MTEQPEFRDVMIALLEEAINTDDLDPNSCECQEHHQRRLRIDIGARVDDAARQSKKAEEAFRNRGVGDTIDAICQKAQAALEQEQYQAVVEACPDEAYDQLLDVALTTLKADELDDAEAMYVFLMLLRPLEHRPYVGLCTVLWKTEGAHAAANMYAELIPRMKSPALLFFAADCFAAAGRAHEAEKALEEGLDLLGEADDEDTQQDMQLRITMQNFLYELRRN